MVDARKESFELVLAEDIPAIFTCLRVDRESIPEELFCYDIRHDDDCQGIACEIAPFVIVNHWGTIITKQEIPLEDGHHYLTEDINYLGKPLSLEEFIRADIDQIVAEEFSSETITTPQINM